MDTCLILASGSPRRKALLEMLGIEVEVIPSGMDEDFRSDESPREHVLRLASEKAGNVADRFPERWVIGADTVVVIDGEVLGKPENPGDARRMLSSLSGRFHRVLTGYAIINKGMGASARDVLETKVKVKHLGSGEMDWYIRTGEPFGKAGGYAAQGIGSFIIEEIKGSYTNVVGLPVCQVVESLHALGAVDLK
jgi:septum formation protein